MKRKILVFALLLFLLAPAAGANGGPPLELTVMVVNAPEGELLVDLLAEDLPDSTAASARDPAREQLASLERDGWGLACSSGYAYGELTPDSDGLWRFYLHVPETFYIAAATAEEAQVSSTLYTRAYNDFVVYDWAANTVRHGGGGALYFLAQLLSTLLPTLLIEGAVLWSAGFRRRSTWILFLVLNLATQVFLHVQCHSTLFYAATPGLYFYLLGWEVLIWALEATVFAAGCRERTIGSCISSVVVGNILSYILGLLPLMLLTPLLRRLM